MKDEIVIAEACGGEVRIHAAVTTEVIEQARIHHRCMATSAAALGRTLTVTAVMASDLKNPDEKITSVINGHGPAGTVLAQADGAGNVRGFIGDPNIYLSREDGHLDVGKAVGTDGTLTVIKDLGLREPFSGVVKLQSGEIGNDFTYYYTVSEQTPSMVGVGVLVEPEGQVSAAGGLIVQMLPGASEKSISFCEEVSRTMKPVTQLVKEGNSAEEMILAYFPDAKILDRRDVRWHCGCSRERYMVSLSLLPAEDLQEMIDDGKGAEICCQYCGHYYHFDTDDLKTILGSKLRA